MRSPVWVAFVVVHTPQMGDVLEIGNRIFPNVAADEKFSWKSRKLGYADHKFVRSAAALKCSGLFTDLRQRSPGSLLSGAKRAWAVASSGHGCRIGGVILVGTSGLLPMTLSSRREIFICRSSSTSVGIGHLEVATADTHSLIAPAPNHTSSCKFGQG